MKIPFLPIHIMTTGTLGKKIDAAESSTRKTSNRQMSNLLYDNVYMAEVLQGKRSSMSRRKG